MKRLGLIAVLAASTLSAQAAPRMISPISTADSAQLEAVRKDVWVSWYSGDTTALRRVLAPELVAISPASPTWSSLSEMLAASAAFKASGATLVSVSFSSTTLHPFGAVVVMFSRYAAVTRVGTKESTQAGRVTEVFVRSGGRWVHTSWHLDVGQ